MLRGCRPATTGGLAKAVRAWAQANGVAVNARGRLKADIVEQYHAATTGSADVTVGA